MPNNLKQCLISCFFTSILTDLNFKNLRHKIFLGEMCEENVDECYSNPCQNNATCKDVANGYFCQCVPGYSGNHKHSNRYRFLCSSK